ncbi:methyltransferase [Neoasaia chiangmaiensis NBRC 101099]|uniref:Methyltransferase small domain-containing protein n=1 Tax=Neoasaia chiangmaiensis TaxID=320497 RepID=A0A1U9KN95_9PROT|nr:methyltransferase [Neoasaia chiangmaiensis]AQS87259.1 hypothetical protein A0U93_04105 [Neoasaia chiangmaiensis]GBR38477.1 methyltransferase [Neoasaia chiangmaiensis NBRC 101099]GEN15878.1 methyltransferase [Neoasaia chiangmaiensis]
MSGGGQTVNPITPIQTCPNVTDGTLLGGRVVYRQFAIGYRTGLEPVLMAAFVPARTGEHVLEAGCGAGAGLLCLHARIPDLHGVGLEYDEATMQLATDNFRANNAEHLHARRARLPSTPQDLRALAPSPNGRFHHTMANPPWHRHDASLSPDARRRLALFAPPDGWQNWIGTLAQWTLPGGTINLALPAAAVDEACIALRAVGCGSLILLPLWPKVGRSAKIVLLRATLGGRAAFRLEPGLILHNPDGQFTSAAQAILREGHGFPPL